MNWSDLSMSQRSELMSIYLKNGITSLDEMKKHYNSFAEGGSTDIPPFAKRYNEGQRRAIPTSQGNATHYMAVDSYNGKHYVYPTIQPIDYNDTNSPLKYYGDRAFDRALENNDVMEFPTLSDAIRYTENYKRPPSTGAYLNNEYHPVYTPYDYIRSFDTGGLIDPRRFFGIATPKVTDNNIYYSRNSLLPEVNVTAKGDPRKVNNDYYKAHSRTRANIQDSHARAGLQYLSTVGQGLSALSYFTGLGEAALPIKMGFRGLIGGLGKETARNAPQYIMQLPDVITDVSDPEAVPILLDSPGRIVSKVDDAIPLGKLSFLKYLDNWIPPVGAAYDAYGALTPEEDKGFSKGGSIHIKPENRGKFTALKKRTGHSASWFKENGTPAQKKMAVFALNARKWKH